MNRWAIWILLVGVGWLSSSASLACSVLGEYVRPTNFELVQMADAIVVASAVKQTREGSNSTVRFRTRETFKGNPPAEFDISWASIGKPIPSDPEELANPNVEAFHGPCIRTTFSNGKSYVIFLAKDGEGHYNQLGYPFTRVNEDYFGPDSLWVRTIKGYLHVQRRFSSMEQLTELERVMQLKSAQPSDDNQKQAMDIVDHLKSRSPFKPTEYLVTTYETLERGEAPRFMLRPPSEDQEKSGAQALTNAIFGTAAPDVLDREDQMEFVLASLVNGDHPGAMALFDRLISKQSIPPRSLGLSLRFLAKNGRFERAFELMQTRALSLLPLLSASDAEGLVGDIAAAMRGDNWQEGKELWRTRSPISAQWPKIALRLYWYQYYLFGPNHVVSFDDELDSLPMKDYRSRPELTLARARNFDSDVEAWAIAELSNETQRLAYEARLEAEDDAADLIDPAAVPMQALVLAYGKERDAALLRVFCQSEARRASLIQSLGRWADDLDKDLIARIAATPELTEEEHDMLGMAVAAIYGQRAEFARRFGTANSWLDSGDDWYELLKKIVSREVSDAKPIACKP